ncbi:polysaccharide pyruvyl transferase family protein [Brevibacterium sp. 1718]|uniref:polysaccharide pyruvyl transferase family protein n=1 Tax=Brevibacterium sp. 1718 TaxID=3413510 RepID=UPI003DAA3E27
MKSHQAILDALQREEMIAQQINHARANEKEAIFSIIRTGHRLTVSIQKQGSNQTVLSVLGRDSSTQQLLRGALIGSSRMQIEDGDEYHAISSLSGKVTESQLKHKLFLALDEIGRRINAYESKIVEPNNQNGTAAMYWWDSVSNFGDMLGPWLINRRYSIKPVNRWRSTSIGPALASAGSIIPLIDQSDTYIWGSGMLTELNDSHISRLGRLRNISVLASRGQMSAEQMASKLKWNVPEVFGDPALLTSRYFTPELLRKQDSGDQKIALVCHWEHQKYFTGTMKEFVFVNVKDGLENVIESIANSQICISTSLHGIIIAQSYGVPWVWLQIDEHRLHSTDFKFRDFMTTVDESMVSRATLSVEELNSATLKAIASSCSLPSTTTDLDRLDDSLDHWASIMCLSTVGTDPEPTPVEASRYKQWLPPAAR